MYFAVFFGECAHGYSPMFPQVIDDSDLVRFHMGEGFQIVQRSFLTQEGELTLCLIERLISFCPEEYMIGQCIYDDDNEYDENILGM